MSWTLVIHGGAGRITPEVIGAAADRGARAALAHALEAGAAVLDAGGAALDATEAAVRVLEDDPHFNAGRGAVLTAEGRVELDAAVMDGTTRAAGAVAGVTRPRNPVALARAVLRHGRHVLLAGEGADRFAAEHAVEAAAPDWHELPERRAQLAELLAAGDGFDAGMKYGTVGAVARDVGGHVAAATSTGGVTGKRWRRIGDTPVPGAGTWADDRACAVSCTGSGEVFLRVGAAHEVAARVRLAGEPLPRALDAVLAEIVAMGGTGGLIAVAPDGTPGWAFSTPGMYRGRAGADGERLVAIYAGE
jgi:L-asparaginase / beta-aspartyl-peptidase